MNSIPPEIFFLIAKALREPNQDNESIQAYSSLIPLSLTSKYFHSLTSNLINSELNFDSLINLVRFKSSLEVYPTLFDSTRKVQLFKPTFQRPRTWNSNALESLLITNGMNLSEFSVVGMARDLEGLEKCWKQVKEDNKLIKLSIDFEEVTTRTFLSTNSPSSVDSKPLLPTSNSFPLECLNAFSHLEKLRLSHLPPPTSTSGINRVMTNSTLDSTNLLELELEESILTDDILLSLFSRTTKLRRLSIKNCRGFTPQGFSTALKLVLPDLVSLELIFDPPLVPNYVPSSSPLSAHMSPTTTSPIRVTSTIISSHIPPPSTTTFLLLSLLDPILNLAISLQSLSLTGPLLSLFAFERALAESSLLQSLEFNNLYWDSVGCRDLLVQCEERGIKLKGRESECWKERLKWAEMISCNLSSSMNNVEEEEEVVVVQKQVGKRKRPGVCREVV